MRAAYWIACGGGLGRAPRAPGTVGSAGAALLGAALLAASPLLLLAGLLAVTLIGWWAIRASGGGDDPGWVVIDEVAGQFVALLALARPTLAGVGAAFLLFRLFDIAKPGPVSWAERLPGAAGVMADDLVAGGLAAGVLLLVQRFVPAAFAG